MDSSESNSAVISLQGVTKSHRDVEALTDITLSIESGCSTALLGPNGAGKSTLLNLILGSMRPDSGQVSVFGLRPGSIAARLRSGAMLQVTGVPATLTVQEHIELFRTYYIEPLTFEEAVQRANLAGLERRRYGTLSGGEKQRLHFALAICGQPQLLVLDEPTTAMDVQTRLSMWEQIRQFMAEGRTLLLSTHNLRECEELAERVILLNQGRILADNDSKAIRSMVSSTVVSAVSCLDPRELAQLPGVLRVDARNGRIHLFVNAPQQTVKSLLDQDPGLEDLTVQPAPLEEAYLHLVEDRSSTP